jgi:F-type H+-transporting ATPase subunit delta
MAAPRVSIRYAKSLIGLASERGVLVEVERDVRSILTAIEGSRELELMLASPVIKTDTKENVITRVFGAHLDTLTLAFLRILLTKGREPLVRPICEATLRLLREMKGVHAATIRTAQPLEPRVRERLVQRLNAQYAGGVELTEVVDSEVLGGFVLRVDDRMLDASVKRQLTLIRRELTENEYEPEF